MDWTGNRESVFRSIGASNHSPQEREKNDYYATDPKAIDLLLTKERPAPQIWECACGEGYLSKRLTELGFKVYSSDLIARGFGEQKDFLKQTELPLPHCDILTNPPYKYAAEFVLKALELAEPGSGVYMFLKLTFLEGQKRRQLIYKPHPPQKVCVFTRRINCARGGDFETYSSAAVAYAWYIWRKGYKGRTYIEWI